MKKTKKMLLSGMIFLLLPIFITSCGKKEESIKNGTIIFTLGDVKLNGKAAEVGNKVFLNDIIKTDKNALTTIQFSKVAVLTIRSSTTVGINELVTAEGRETIGINQGEGSTFNKIVKKGIKYNVKTPTVVASVRGTSFNITLTKKKSTIQLLKGKVKLIRVVKKDEKKSEKETETGIEKEESSIILTAGNSIVSDEKEISKPVKISKEDTEELKQFNKISLISKEKIKIIEKHVEKKKSGEKSLEKEEVIPEIIKEKLKKEIIKIEMKKNKSGDGSVKKMTLKDLKKKYGALSIIETNRGKKHIGSFKQKGTVVEVITIKGKVRVQSKDVKKISRYNM